MSGPITYVTSGMSLEQQHQARQNTASNFAQAQDSLDKMARKRQELARQKAQAQRQKLEEARAEIEMAERAAQAKVRIAARKLDDSQWQRYRRRREFLDNPWNLFRVWFYGLFGVSAYEVIRSIKDGNKRSD